MLIPFANRLEPPAYDLFLVLGEAYRNSGEYEKALKTYDKAISHYGLNIVLLNAVGECYFRLGIPDEALAAWEKSLEINPDQPEIQKNVKALKQKK